MTATLDRPVIAAPLPGLLSASMVRSSVELKSFFRNRQSLVFTVAFPVILLVVFGSIFTGNVEGTSTDFQQVFVAGIIAAGVMSTAFTGLAMSVALEKDMGTIRRLASTPMPKGAYFVGKLVRVTVTSVIEAALLLAIGVAFFGLQLPRDAAHWLAFGWVLALGIAALSLGGLAYCALIPNARSASAIVTPPFLVLQFISGVFFPFNQLPSWMQSVASLFPLKWMTQGFRYAFLPDDFKAVEAGGTWDLTGIATILTAWIVAGALLTFVSFRWRGPRVR
ncbi:MAG TPA: ABC transporter permease [Mycobacteriales bacterium]|nr:ABC transporter permease [Mycobacteriales bacterium]